MFSRRFPAFAALLAAACLGALGCSGPAGEPTIPVQGTLTKGGEPLPLDPVLAEAKAARVELHFVRIDGGESAPVSATAFADPQGHFEVPNGLPAGKYRIGVKYFDGSPSGDKLQGRFDAQKSPIEREIQGEKATLNIDLDKPDAA
jgi:hypothetical protein